MAERTPGEVTRLIEAIGRGEAGRAEELLDLVYSELRAMAEAAMAHERPGWTLQPTALVHEAYLRLMGARGSVADDAATDEPGSTTGARGGGPPRFENRAHFFAAAGRRCGAFWSMRRAGGRP
ncbi:MAG: ECF-type sigma factor [Phycisphaerales bacterium]